MSSYVAESAWLGDNTLATEVAIDIEDGRFRRLEPGGRPLPGAVRLPGLVLPGLANAHSHAFHRALRGRTQAQRGTFWSWRKLMYELAGRLEPETYHPLARAVFAEAALAGFTAVGEFHYLHHPRHAKRYANPNEMANAVIDAGREAGVRVTLLNTCYLMGGINEPLTDAQRRFSDGSVAAWMQRSDSLRHEWKSASDVRVGGAIHSVRAVPSSALSEIADWSGCHKAPLHVHLSEQPSENQACLEAYGVTPTALLGRAGVLGPGTTAVHATHLSAGDIALLGQSKTTVCVCPTTERDLADGIGPAHELRDAGSPLVFGSDSHAITDPFEEARATELNLRLASLERGSLGASVLASGLSTDGQRSLGFDDAGRLEVGARADLVAVRMNSVRTAGSSIEGALDTVIFAATATDVTDVIVDGRPVVIEGKHRLGNVAELLDEAIRTVDAP